MMKAILLYLAIFSSPHASDGAQILDWLWGPSEPTAVPQQLTNVPMIKVPFEVKSDDEKFLQEAAKFTGMKLSELDVCQHRVVMKIKTSCSSMSEEELAKMSVNLLNCQSTVEGREVFPCTDSMSLRECTTAMDSDMWNTYHLMNNRARAVCYAARHQQFRALSEMTVNKLMSSAHDQLAAMAILKEGQHKLESMTSNTLETVAEGHKTLMEQQERLRNTQHNLQEFVSMNLLQLTREKALIAAGHTELARMTGDVKKKLDEASNQLTSQASQRQDNHQQLVEDLKTIQKQAHLIWEQIEHSTSTILEQHASAALQYEATLVRLSRINDTVNFLLTLVDQTRLELDIRLAWITSFMGGTGDKLEKLYSCLLHATYLLLGMVTTSFLHAPPLTRACLMLIVILNLAVSYNNGAEAALNFSDMSLIIVASSAVNWLFHLLLTVAPACRLSLTLPSSPVTGKESLQRVRALGKRIYCRLSAATEPQGDKKNVESWLKDRVATTTIRQDSSDSESSEEIRYPPTPSRSLSRSRTPGSVSSRRTCIATCASGQLCKNSATPGSVACRLHVSKLR